MLSYQKDANFGLYEVSFNSLEEYIICRENVFEFINKKIEPTFKIFCVAVQEALGNAVKHGEFPVDVKITNSDEEIRVEIKDHGFGFNFQRKINEIKEKGASALLMERIFAESGRGILMMSEICDKVIFKNHGTEVELIKQKNIG